MSRVADGRWVFTCEDSVRERSALVRLDAAIIAKTELGSTDKVQHLLVWKLWLTGHRPLT